MKSFNIRNVLVPLFLSLFFFVSAPAWGYPPGTSGTDVTVSSADISESESMCNISGDAWKIVYLHDSAGGIGVKAVKITKLSAVTDKTAGKYYNTSNRIKPPDLSAWKRSSENDKTYKMFYVFKPQGTDILLC